MLVCEVMNVLNASLKCMLLLMKSVSPFRSVKRTLCSPVWRRAQASSQVQACLDSNGSVCSEFSALNSLLRVQFKLITRGSSCETC